MLLIELKYLCLSILLILPITAQAFDNFDCIGSTPEWKLSLNEKKFTFKQNGAEKILSSVSPTPSENMNIEHIRVYRTKMDKENLVIILQKQSCTDDRTADAFPYEGLIVTNTKVFHGCCSKKLVLTE